MSRALPVRTAAADAQALRQAFLSLDPDAMARFVRRNEPVPASFLERVRIVLMLGRPRTCVPNLLAYGLGFSYTSAEASWRTLAGAVLACCIGFAANLHNAAVELEEDTRNLPGRVWLVATCGLRRVLWFWRALIAAMLITAIMLGGYFALFMGLAVVGLHQYSAPPVRSKGRPVLGLWVFAQTVVFPFLFGWTTEPGRMLETLWAVIGSSWSGTQTVEAAAAHQSLRYLGMWAFLTLVFMAKGAFKNVPDYAGDLAAGVRTSATLCSSRQRAATVAAVATISALLMLIPLVLLGLEAPRSLLALGWLVPVSINGLRLVRADSGRAANAVLRVDMHLSTAFLATLLLLIAPTRVSLAMVGAAAAVLLGSDVLGLDSRREADVSVARAA